MDPEISYLGTGEFVNHFTLHIFKRGSVTINSSRGHPWSTTSSQFSGIH